MRIALLIARGRSKGRLERGYVWQGFWGGVGNLGLRLGWNEKAGWKMYDVRGTER
jgi:hypothetical protein